jgi:IPT/TIG domain
MTDPASLTVSVEPSSLYTSSPEQYQGKPLTLTITAPPSAPCELSGLRIVLPVDPGGSGSGAALVLSSASDTTGGTGQPTATVQVDAKVTQGDWSIQETAPGTCGYQALPNRSGVLLAGESLQFVFDNVVADHVPGSADITVTVFPATATASPLTAPVTKIPAPLTAELNLAAKVQMPDNTTEFSWQVLGATSCALSWTLPTTKVRYNGMTYDQLQWRPAPFQFSGDELPTAILEPDAAEADEIFTLTAYGAGGDRTASQAVHVVPPVLAALTIPPLVTGVSPASGAPEGGQPVTITGTGLFGASDLVTVAFGTASAAAVTVNPDGSGITATVPPHPAGSTVPVTVTTLTGTSPATPAGSFTYAPAGTPVVTGIGQPGGGNAGGQQMTITGPGLAGATAVTFGSVSAGPFTANPDGSLTVTVPPYPLSPGTQTGTVPVTVITPAGSSPPGPAAQYTYAAAGLPVVFAVTQDGAGDCSGGQEAVTITGINLGQATSVNFAAATVNPPDFTVDPAGTTITATAPPADLSSGAGTPSITVDVTVTVAGSSTVRVTSASTPASTYTYANKLESVLPNQPFRLTWSCYNSPAGPTLNWSTSDQELTSVTDTVIVTGAASGLISNLEKIKTAGTAVVTVTAPTTFQIGFSGVPVVPLTVPIGQVELGVPVAVFTPGVLGDEWRYVTLNWTAQHTTGFTLELVTDGSAFRFRFDQRYYGLGRLPPNVSVPLLLTADGFDDSGESASVSQSLIIRPGKNVLLSKEGGHTDVAAPQLAPGTAPGPSNLAASGPAAADGTQQAFIDPDERPGSDAPGAAEPPAEQ